MGEARDRGVGRGKIRWVYTDKTLVEFLIIKELSDFKISVGPIRKIMQQVRQLITTEGDSIYYFCISHAGEEGFNVQAVGKHEPAKKTDCNSYLVINYKRLREKVG